MKVFILASGMAERWGGAVKHLQPVLNTTVLQRQVGMITRYGYRYHILTHRPEIKNKFEHCIEPNNHTTLLNTVKSSSDLWKGVDEVAFILGDVIFTKKCFDTCLQADLNKSFQFYGSADEHFCFRFTPVMRSKVIDNINNILNVSKLGTTWELYRSLVGIPIDKDWTDRWFRTLITDKTDDIDYPEDYKKKIDSNYFDDAEFNI
jgi:hypothetical protein